MVQAAAKAPEVAETVEAEPGVLVPLAMEVAGERHRFSHSEGMQVFVNKLQEQRRCSKRIRLIQRGQLGRFKKFWGQMGHFKGFLRHVSFSILACDESQITHLS